MEAERPARSLYNARSNCEAPVIVNRTLEKAQIGERTGALLAGSRVLAGCSMQPFPGMSLCVSNSPHDLV